MSSQQVSAATSPPKIKNRRKKTGGTGGGASRSTAVSTQSVLAAAARATRELSEIRSQSEAKRNDTAWLSTDVIAVAADGIGSSSSGGFSMNESKVVDAALRNNGIVQRSDITPRGYAVLLEQAKRFACELFADAQDYTWHANRKEVQPVDLKLAADLRFSARSSSLPLEALAEDCNSVPLPPIPSSCYHGVVLPPTESQLTARTFDVISSQSLPPPTDKPAPSALPDPQESRKSKPSYGANKGRQIPINLKSANTTTPVGADAPKSSSSANPDVAETQPIQTDTTNKRKANELTL